MPDLFVPLFVSAGSWIALGTMSIPPANTARTESQKVLGIFAAASFVMMCGFGGGIASSYIPAAVKTECAK